jgi:ERCC4-type nuclease
MSFLNRGKDKKMTFIDLLDSLNMGKLKEQYAQLGKQYIQPNFIVGRSIWTRRARPSCLTRLWNRMRK